MNQTVKTFLVLGIVAIVVNGGFWFVHSFTDQAFDLATPVIGTVVGVALYLVLLMMGKRKKS